MEGVPVFTDGSRSVTVTDPRYIDWDDGVTASEKGWDVENFVPAAMVHIVLLG